MRGTAKLHRGVAIIELPDHFAVATSPEGLRVTLTPVGEWLQLYVKEQSVRRIVVREAGRRSGTFHYRVEGVRKGYERHQVVVRR